jgi:hypothetical protein
MVQSSRTQHRIELPGGGIAWGPNNLSGYQSSHCRALRELV